MTAPAPSPYEQEQIERFGIFAEERVVEEVARAITQLAQVIARFHEMEEPSPWMYDLAAAVAEYRATQDGGAGEAVRDLVHHIARMHDRWADMGAEDPDARNRELWAPLHRKADAVRDLIPGEAL